MREEEQTARKSKVCVRHTTTNKKQEGREWRGAWARTQAAIVPEDGLDVRAERVAQEAAHVLEVDIRRVRRTSGAPSVAQRGDAPAAASYDGDGLGGRHEDANARPPLVLFEVLPLEHALEPLLAHLAKKVGVQQLQVAQEEHSAEALVEDGKVGEFCEAHTLRARRPSEAIRGRRGGGGVDFRCAAAHGWQKVLLCVSATDFVCGLFLFGCANVRHTYILYWYHSSLRYIRKQFWDYPFVVDGSVDEYYNRYHLRGEADQRTSVQLLYHGTV